MKAEHHHDIDMGPDGAPFNLSILRCEPFGAKAPMCDGLRARFAHGATGDDGQD